MADIVDRATRSRMMAGIRGEDTKPELLVRKKLHAHGFRYVLGGAGLPGRPDIVLTRWKVAIFVHGCFWHLHRCSLSKIPSANRCFWGAKLHTNEARDVVATISLLSAGWRVALVWECALRGQKELEVFEERMDTLAEWIPQTTGHTLLEIP